MQQEPLVSVIIRTHERPSILRTALDSISKQTYRNIEVVIVEDGKNVSEKLVEREYGFLNFKYFSTGERTGRSHVGNIGLKMASGDYINFLDDDDEIYPQHIEKLMQTVQNENKLAVYSVAEERQIRILSKEPYTWKLKRRLIRYRQPFLHVLLYYQNYMPIQSVLFSRKLYERMGGFDESLDALEDWDLWIRYSTISDFSFMNEITSAYYVEYSRKAKKKRDLVFHRANDDLIAKFNNYETRLSVYTLQQEMKAVIEGYNEGRVIRYLRRIWNFLFYGDH